MFIPRACESKEWAPAAEVGQLCTLQRGMTIAQWSTPFSEEAKPQSSPESPTGTARQGQRVTHTGPVREHESERVFGAMLLGDLTLLFSRVS